MSLTAVTACDYSDARPGGKALADAGVQYVGRYLAPEGDSRAIELPEYTDLIAHNLKLWFVREGAATGMDNGYTQGVNDATVADANLARIGVRGALVYAAADWDVTEAEFPQVDAYMRGFAVTLGGTNRVGIYGGMFYLNHARDNKLATKFWKSAASSWDHGETGAVDIVQTLLAPPVPDSDHDYYYVSNDPTEEENMKNFMIYIKNSNGTMQWAQIPTDLSKFVPIWHQDTANVIATSITGPAIEVYAEEWNGYRVAAGLAPDPNVG